VQKTNEIRNDMTTVTLTTTDLFHRLPNSLSQICEIRVSSRANAELTPSTMSVRKNIALQNCAPGICAVPSGRVRKAISKLPRRLSEAAGSMPRYPMTPNTARPHKISISEFEKQIMSASWTAFWYLLLYEA
jgi:hypothetical protein